MFNAICHLREVHLFKETLLSHFCFPFLLLPPAFLLLPPLFALLPLLPLLHLCSLLLFTSVSSSNSSCYPSSSTSFSSLLSHPPPHHSLLLFPTLTASTSHFPSSLYYLPFPLCLSINNQELHLQPHKHAMKSTQQFINEMNHFAPLLSFTLVLLS